ncbi:rod-binding protein [Hydrogenimonas sp. SS33]|uniref:rod-binding protein n=1 Tax=Hydrogenimonas leucolamina TaxID=2954236 RepID=UPI00336BF124
MQIDSVGYRPQVPSLTASDRKRLKKETDAFEAIIIKMLLDKAIESKESLLPKDPGRDIYRSMMNDERSKQLSGAFGYSELLFNYLTEKRT